MDRPQRWIHAVFNFIGPNDGQGIRIYEDGNQIGSDNTKYRTSNSASSQAIAIGRIYTDDDHYYGSVQVDEVLFYNQVLTSAEITKLSQNTV